MKDLKTMAALTKEQQEYIDLKKATDRMMNRYVQLIINDKISRCTDFKTPDQPQDIIYRFEEMFYAYLEILQEDHRNFKNKP